MKHNQLALCCCWLLFATGCDDGSGQAGRDVPLLGSTDRHDAMSRFVQDFMEVPLEGSDEASDSCAYRNACEIAETIAGKIWELSGDPDKVIDFWTIQRKWFDAEAERCAVAFRRAIEKEYGMTKSGEESRRFHNLRCLYLYPIEMRDEHVLMEVVSNKFFSVDRKEFDKSMIQLRKVLGRNYGYDEQLRLLYPDRK